MSDPVLSVSGVSKRFCRDLRTSLLYGARDMAGALLRGRRPPRPRPALRRGEFWALEDISFDVARGESVGLIGANGSGKTTLLRVISGLIRPNGGVVEVRGRIAPLLALGAGFNPVLSGRENVFVNMALLGLDSRRIRERFDRVLAFADIGDAIDAPVRTYSSGMTARLGFACAVHTDPDILLIDEVLSVGDIRFRTKCHNRLAELRRAGTTFVLVSHSPVSILALCDSAVYLGKGRLRMRGATAEALARYEADQCEEVPGEAAAPRQPSTSGVTIEEVRLEDSAGAPVEAWSTGAPAWLSVTASFDRPVAEVSMNLLVRELMGEMETPLFLQSRDDLGLVPIAPGRHRLRLALPACGLRPGPYAIKLNLTSGPEVAILDLVENVRIRVKAGAAMTQCSFYQPRAWEIGGGAAITPR
jgi:lipopolysaccharide transport system ATP-binding protein